MKEWKPKPKQKKVLEAAMTPGLNRTITAICKEAEVSTRSFYNWLGKDEDFKEAWNTVWEWQIDRYMPSIVSAQVKEAQDGVRMLAKDKLEGATEYAIQLAEGTEKHEWIDWIFAAHDAHDALLEPEVIDRLHELVRKARYRKSSVFRRYMQNLRDRSAQLSKGDQFTLRRLEAVERVVDA